MADKDEVKEKKKEDTKEKKGKKEKQEKKGKEEGKKAEEGEKKSFIARFLPQIIIVVVVVFFGSVGFTLGRMFAGSSAPQTAYENGQSPDIENANGSENGSEGWYYQLEPVIANLNVSDVTRYVKASLILEVNSEVDEKEGKAFLDSKKPILTNWLNVFLASLGLDDIRGDSNLKHIQSEVLDAFNEKLFPDSKPQIKRILFQEFAVQ
jgi:flagellar basal body-associated protein FliL